MQRKTAGGNTLHVGVIGCGGALHLHVPGILHDKRVSLQAVCDANTEIAHFCSRELKCRAYSDVSSFLQEEKPDAVHLLTPPHTHLEIGSAVLRSGSHLLLEKPMTLDLKEGEQLKAEAEQHGRIMTIVHNHLFDPNFIKARKVVRIGGQGKPLHVQVTYCLNRKETKAQTTRNDHWVNRLPIPVFSEWLPHTVYITRELIGPFDVDNVSVHTEEQRQWITIGVSGRSASGEIAILDNTDYELFHVQIFLEKAIIRLNMVDLTLSVFSRRSLPGVGPYMVNTLAEALLDMKSIAGNATRILLGKLRRKQGHMNLIRSFYDHLSGNGKNPVSPDDGIDVVRTIDAVRELVQG